MKKLTLIAISALFSVSVVLGGPVLAQSDISDTGPDSENVIINEDNCEIIINNSADISVDNDNDQDADTGDSTVDENTTGGDSESGDAGNDNSTDISVIIDNATEADLEECLILTSGNDDGGDVEEDESSDEEEAGAVLSDQSQNLPDTGVDSPAEVALIAATATVSLAVVARLAIAANARFSS